MNRIYVVLISILALALLVGSLGGSSSAAPKRGKVICKIVKLKGKQRVSCPKSQLRGKKGKRGRRGRPGRVGATGPTGPAGERGPSGAGSGLTLNFNTKLNAGQVKQLAIGNFTIRAAAQSSGNCENIKLLVGATDSVVSIGSNGPFEEVLNNKSKNLQSGNTSNMFTAVSADGGSTVSGIVGRVNSGGFCLVSGYVTGV